MENRWVWGLRENLAGVADILERRECYTGQKREREGEFLKERVADELGVDLEQMGSLSA